MRAQQLRGRDKWRRRVEERGEDEGEARKRVSERKGTRPDALADELKRKREIGRVRPRARKQWRR